MRKSMYKSMYTIRIHDCGFGLDFKMLFGFYTDFVFYALSGCCLDSGLMLVGFCLYADWIRFGLCPDFW